MIKAADTSKAASALDSAQLTGIKTPRQFRVVMALLNGPKSRERIDRIAGASNGPEIVRQLRANGICINCELVPHINCDSKLGKHGVYYLPATQKRTLRRWLSQKGGL